MEEVILKTWWTQKLLLSIRFILLCFKIIFALSIVKTLLNLPRFLNLIILRF